MKKIYYINTTNGMYQWYINPVIYGKPGSNFMIAITYENRKIGIPYFKVYNGKRFDESTKVMRVCFKSPEILTNYIENTAEQWELNDFKKVLPEILEKLNLTETYSSEIRKKWDYLKFEWNDQITGYGLSYEDYSNGKYDEIYADNLDYLPSNLEMPNYLNLKEMNCFEEDESKNEIIKSSKSSKISISIDSNDDIFIDEPYFKVYKNDLKTNSLKVWAISPYRASLFKTFEKNGTESLKSINETTVNSIIKYLKSKSLNSNDTVWKELKFKWNVQKGFTPEDDYIDYKSGKYDKLYKGHPFYIPYKSPIPNYRNLWKEND